MHNDHLNYFRLTVIVLPITILLVLTACNVENRHTPRQSWFRTCDCLVFLFLEHERNQGSLPYDERGQEYALYDMLKQRSYNNEQMKNEWGSKYLPFEMDDKEKKVKNLRVDYMNPKPNEAPPGAQPVRVLMALRQDFYHEDKLLVIGTDLIVYEVLVDTENELIMSTYDCLGLPLSEVTKDGSPKRVGGLKPSLRKKLTVGIALQTAL